MASLQEKLALEALQNKIRAGALRHALVSGKEVGAIAPDVAKMTQAEAMAELDRLDRKMGAGTFTKADEARMIDVELRLEQFSNYSADVVDPNQNWDYYEKLAQANKGKVDPVYQGPVTQMEEIQVRGTSYAPWILGGLAFLALAFRNKLK